MMHWGSLDDFFSMGGYGFYVWLSFGLTAMCAVVELWQLRSRRQQLAEGESA